MFVFFNLTFFPMHTMGLAGMMRRIADPTQYEHLRNLQPLQKFISHHRRSGWVRRSWCSGTTSSGACTTAKRPSDNPWRANTLEWTLPSPVTLHGNFPETPRVYHGPYEYSIPGMEDDFLPQNDAHARGPADGRRGDPGALGAFPMGSAR